jgi:hypothetical protein
MHIPLDRLKHFELATPGPGQISLAVARHEAATWPSREVEAYARHRAQLIHELIDDTGTRVVSLGDTDASIPREVVQVILETAAPLVSSIAALVTAWVGRPRKGGSSAGGDTPEPPPDTQVMLPGIKVKRHDGAELLITYRDGLSNKAIESIMTQFLEGAGDGTAGA